MKMTIVRTVPLFSNSISNTKTDSKTSENMESKIVEDSEKTEMNEMSEMLLDDVAVLLIQKECSEEDSDDLFRDRKAHV